MATLLEDLPLTVNPVEVMRDEETWISIAKPDETPIPYASFTTADSATSFDPTFDYKTPSFQHLSNVLSCSGFNLTHQEQSYLLSAISATKSTPPPTHIRRPSSSGSVGDGVRSGRIHKLSSSHQQPQRRFSKPSDLRETCIPGNVDPANPFASLAPLQHSLGPKDIPRFYGMRITAQEIDMLEELLSHNCVDSGPPMDELASPVPSLGWSEGDDVAALSPFAVESETVHPSEVFHLDTTAVDDDAATATATITSSGGVGAVAEKRRTSIAGISISLDEEDTSGKESGKTKSKKREEYKAECAPIRAYSWKERLSPARRSSVGI